MNDKERYETIDLPFYRREIAPILPPKVLDFHTHIWSADNWKTVPWKEKKRGGKYMVVQEQYHPETLISDGCRCFPDREYHAVCFGFATPAIDWEKDTAFIAAAARKRRNLHPLVIGGPDLRISRERYEQAFDEGGFYGFKVLLNWYGDNYGDKRIEEMIGPVEMALANERRLIILLHVPRSGRLVDPVIQRGIHWLSKECPEASIVLAHAGRCYLPVEIKAAIGSIRKLDNVSMDLSMVMDPVTIRFAMEAIGPGRLIYGSDFPVAAMRGRRVSVMDHWVDVVLDGYAASAFRVAGDIHATFMAWEIALAIRWAAELSGLKHMEHRRIFWDNGINLLKRVRHGFRFNL